MPIYEYHCPNCNRDFELMRPLSEADDPVMCPQCNSEAEKLLSGFACKTGTHLQASPIPFRKGITEKGRSQQEV